MSLHNVRHFATQVLWVPPGPAFGLFSPVFNRAAELKSFKNFQLR